MNFEQQQRIGAFVAVIIIIPWFIVWMATIVYGPGWLMLVWMISIAWPVQQIHGRITDRLTR